MVSAKNATPGRPTHRFIKVLDVGGGTQGRAKKEFPDADITTVDLHTGWDIESRGLPLGDWDVIFVNHVIEHLYDVDRFLTHCILAMQPKTVLNIGTPNLCAWFNRLVFLAGYFPHSYEVSSFNVGRIRAWREEVMGGHVHLFTPKALVQLLNIYGFRNIHIKGEPSTYNGPAPIMFLDKILTKNVNLASAFRVKCTL